MDEATIPDPADRPFLVALLALVGVGPIRLRWLLRSAGPSRAWEKLVAGEYRPEAGGPVTAEMLSGWRSAARAIDPAEHMAAIEAAGVSVAVRGEVAYPAAVEAGADPPLVLFSTGPAPVLDHQPTVAVVGTRRCTRYGYETARLVGRQLADAGVRVVSGLALGVDGAAHLGALEAAAAPPVGVVASGLDVVYPRRHRRLWADVAAAGTLMSEACPGTQPERWRFPARNRIIVALSQAVVVVESHETGGSLVTAELAIDHDVPVYAVPGPVFSSSSAGTNRLLGDAGRPFRSVDELLVDLGIRTSGRSSSAGGPGASAALGPHALRVRDAFGWAAVTLDELVSRLDLSVDVVVSGLEELVNAGVVVERGGWFEQLPPASRP